MTQPRAFGRLLPRNDWEGDDGAYSNKTCMDTAAGRDVAWATNGRINKDGKEYRAALTPPDLDGINVLQVRQAVKDLTGLNLLIKRDPGLPLVQRLLAKGNGMVVWGNYSSIPRSYRHQDEANFAHALFLSHWSPSNKSIRVWDALNPDRLGYGRWIPEAHIYRFMSDYNYDFAYVPLQPLTLP